MAKKEELRKPGAAEDRKILAILISTREEQLDISPEDFAAGFTKPDMDRLIQGDCKAFPLKSGDLLLLDCLACKPRNDERNDIATRWLRNAVADPGGDVSGYALLLSQQEVEPLSPSDKAALSLDRIAELPKVLLLDHNEGVRPVIAMGLERYHFLVIHARTAADTVGFCQSHPIQVLVADVSSLYPEPLRTLEYVREAQPLAKILLISGYEVATIASLCPGLLTGAEFLQKPFELNVLANIAHWMNRTEKTLPSSDTLMLAKTDSG